MTSQLKRAISLSVCGVATVLLAKRLLRGALPSFRGQCVVITGGARGLGLEMARIWAAEGARVALCSRTTSEVHVAVNELRRQGHEVYGETCDVTDQREVDAFLAGVSTRYGPIEVLVNNAGIIQTGPVDCRRGTAELTLSVQTELAVRGHALFHDLSMRLLDLVNGFLPSANGNDRSRKGWQSFSRWSPSWITTLNERAAVRNREFCSPSESRGSHSNARDE